MIEIIMPTGKYIIDFSAPIDLSSSPSQKGTSTFWELCRCAIYTHPGTSVKGGTEVSLEVIIGIGFGFGASTCLGSE